MQFALADPSNPSATPQDLLQKLMVMAASSPGLDGAEEIDFTRLDSNEKDDDDEDNDDNDLETSDETEDPKDLNKLDVSEKKKKRLRLKRLKKKTKARAYEFSGGTDVVGIVFLEVCKITDLPPERNSKLKRQKHNKLPN